MLIVLTLIALLFGVKWTRALEGGIKLAIALTAISDIINILTTAYQVPLDAFVKSTGISLKIIDVGWVPLATITWGSPYTLFFLLIMIIVNIIMLFLNKTNSKHLIIDRSKKDQLISFGISWSFCYGHFC